MDTLFKIVLIFAAFLVAIVLAVYLMVQFTFPDVGPAYNRTDLIQNYEQKKAEIKEAKHYFESIAPKDKNVYVEFEKNKVAILRADLNGICNSYYDLPVDADSTMGLIKYLGWTKAELETLQQKLEEANCISIENNDSTITVGWQRSGLGMYFYKIHEAPLNDSLINVYEHFCTYSYYKENIMLEYAGGAIGSQCFPKE